MNFFLVRPVCELLWEVFDIFMWPKYIFSAHSVVLLPRDYSNLPFNAISMEINEYHQSIDFE